MIVNENNGYYGCNNVDKSQHTIKRHNNVKNWKENVHVNY